MCVLFARLISPIRWLHKFKVIDLDPKTAKGLSGASMGLWGTVVGIDFVQAARDLTSEIKPAKVKEHAWTAIQSGIELVALPFDFGLGASHPGLAIAGSIINMISAAAVIVKEAVS